MTYLQRVVVIILRVGDSSLTRGYDDTNQVALTVDPHLLIRHVRRVQPIRVAVVGCRGPSWLGPSGVPVLEPTRPTANDAQICRHDLSFAHQYNVSRHQGHAAARISTSYQGTHCSVCVPRSLLPITVNEHPIGLELVVHLLLDWTVGLGPLVEIGRHVCILAK